MILSSKNWKYLEYCMLNSFQNILSLINMKIWDDTFLKIFVNSEIFCHLLTSELFDWPWLYWLAMNFHFVKIMTVLTGCKVFSGYKYPVWLQTFYLATNILLIASNCSGLRNIKIVFCEFSHLTLITKLWLW